MWQARSCSVCHLLNVVQSAWDQRIYVAGFDPQELHSLAVFFSALQGRKQRLNDYIPVSRAGYGMQK